MHILIQDGVAFTFHVLARAAFLINLFSKINVAE